jgi:hypothetical protein
VSSSRHVVFALPALLGLLTACSGGAPKAVATSVCELGRYSQRTAKIDAEISVDVTGRTVIGDARCATTKIELRLSAAALRAGAAEQLKTASQGAVSGGKTSFAVKLTGIFADEPTGAYFIAENVTGLPVSK